MNDPYDIALRQRAETIQIPLLFGVGAFFDVPNIQNYILWAASMMNDTVAAEPQITAYYTGVGSDEFHWPTVPAGSGPPGAGEWGSIVDPAFYPQVLPGGSHIVALDAAQGALHQATLELLITIVQKEDYNGR